MCIAQMATDGLVRQGTQLRNKALAGGVPSGLFDKVAQDNRNRSDSTWVDDAIVRGFSGGSSQKSATQKVAKKATTVSRKTPTTATRGAVNKRSTILTSSRGTEAPANIKRKTLLGA
jgi:hypothetical protein